MADKDAEAAELEEQKQAQLAFDGGFSEQETPKPVVVEATAAEEQPAKVEETLPAAEPPKPEFVQLTKEQFDDLIAGKTNAAAKLASIEQQLSRVHGAMGFYKTAIDKLQAQTPAGEPVTLSDEDFADLAKDFPEVAVGMRKSLENALKKVRGTGPVQAAPDPEEIDKRVEAKLRGREMEALDEAYPDWRVTVGAVDTTSGQLVDPNNPFRKWLATQPKEYQEKVEGANRASTINAAIDKFMAATKKPAPVPPKPKAPVVAAKPVVRPNRFEAAITPRGGGAPPPAPSKTLEDSFNEGFASR